jgi:putative component of membrane protein insertase Oxa1/YidC/SpoIIIJ protein YidD
MNAGYEYLVQACSAICFISFFAAAESSWLTMQQDNPATGHPENNASHNGADSCGTALTSEDGSPVGKSFSTYAPGSDSYIAAFFCQSADTESNQKTHASGATISPSEGAILVKALLKFYKGLISSQDGETCSFKESCSIFGARMIAQKGVMKGMLLAADRFTRCAGVNPRLYEIDSEVQKNIDNIERYAP